jgi:hypothetical protein
MTEYPAGAPDRPQAIHTWQDAEECAAAWLRAMGHPDAHVTAAGADGGIDVIGQHVLAQVKFGVVKASRPELQQLRGAAHGRDVDLHFFTTAGYTTDALSWATEVGIAAFVLGLDGYATPMNEHAKRAARVAAAAPQWQSRPPQPGAPRPRPLRARAPSSAPKPPGVWRRIGAWFGRLFRTVAFEAGGARGAERGPDPFMPGAQLVGSGLGITIVGIIGVAAMATTVFDPVERAEDGIAQAIGGVIFYALVAAFGVCARKLGAQRRLRHSTTQDLPAPR